MRRRHRIALVCDFFVPRSGGVEIHIWSLAQSLLKLGHHVVVVTHVYGDRVGVRVMTNGLRVYYLPLPAFAQDNALPALYVSLPLMREVFIRERVEIVHGHQATSSLSHEAMMHAKVLGGIYTVFTDHSLFGFADVASIHLNKVLKFSLSNADMCIGVSEACRANLVLRASLDPARVKALPNAVDASMFTPNVALRDAAPRVNVVVLSRLAHRKGIDLVAFHMCISSSAAAARNGSFWTKWSSVLISTAAWNSWARSRTPTYATCCAAALCFSTAR